MSQVTIGNYLAQRLAEVGVRDYQTEPHADMRGPRGSGGTLPSRLGPFIYRNGFLAATASYSYQASCACNRTTSPTMMSVGGASCAASASCGSVASVPTTVRWRGVVPCCTIAAGVVSGTPRATSSRHSVAKPRRPMYTTRVRPGRKSESRSEEHTSELQSRQYLVCRLLLEKK